jgi:hypothetical protein
VKNILKNLALIVFTAAVSLVIAEVALRMEGRYHDLASQVLVPSLAIWDRPANQIDFSRHPDLTVPIEIRFDRDGVRNHSEPSIRDIHATYLAVSAYYKVRTLVELVRTGKWEWISIGPADWSKKMREGYPERFHDQYADAITTDFLSLDPSASTLRLSQKFLALLEKWKREVEASQRTFTVPVLSWKIEDEVATKLFQNFDGNVVHSLGILENCKKCTFKSDGHWNEYGNAKMAEFILSNRRFPFQGKFRMTNISGLKIEIDEYYNRLQP